MFWFHTGICGLALLLGFLVGASSSPVAGVAITASFGLLAGMFAFFQKAALEKALKARANLSDQLQHLAPRIKAGLNALGRTLFIFAVAFAIGIGLGVYARLGQPFATRAAPRDFPWQGLQEPASGQAAVDWIIVQERLVAMGYSTEQVRDLYRNELSHKEHRSILENPGLISPLFSNTGWGNQLLPSTVPVIADEYRPRWDVPHG